MSDEEQAPRRPGHEPGPGPTHGAEEHQPVGGPYAFAPQGGGPGLGDPGLYPGTDPASVGPARPTDPAESDSTSPSALDQGSGAADRGEWIPTLPDAGEEPAVHPKRDRTRPTGTRFPLLLIIGGAVILLGLLIWLLVSLFGGADDEARVDPSSLAAGECLADFAGITEDAVLVDCTEAHNAQLVASEDYPDDAQFPGREQLGIRAETACAAASADINPDVVTEDLQVTLLRATPTAETWADGDRRVDCFAVVENGDTVTQSLLNP
jgi:hypothetical protein